MESKRELVLVVRAGILPAVVRTPCPHSPEEGRLSDNRRDGALRGIKQGGALGQSERQPEGKDHGVIVGVKLGGGYLDSRAQRQPEAVVKRHAAHHQARRHKELLLAVIGPAIPGREVKLQLRPQKTGGVLLEGRIPGKGPAELARAAGG